MQIVQAYIWPPIVFISIHGVVTQFVNVSFLCVPVHKDTTREDFDSGPHVETKIFFAHVRGKCLKFLSSNSKVAISTHT